MMKAAWYESKGAARAVLKVGERDTPQPGAGDVRVRIHRSAVNPSDTKQRGGARGNVTMPFPFVIPHQDGAGVIDAVEADFFSIKGFKWFEQAKHLTLSYHWFLPKAVRVNTRWLDSLPSDLQALVRQSAKEVFAEQRKENRAKTEEALADLVKAGVTVHKLSADESAKWFSTARPLFDEFGNKSAETKTMVGRILAAR
jgi:hypothetical protein